MNNYKVTLTRNNTTSTFLVLAINKVHATEIVANHEGIRISNGYDVKATKYNGYSNLPASVEII